MSPSLQPERVEPLAEDALLLHFGQDIGLTNSDRVHAAAARLADLPRVECTPAYASLLLRFDPWHWQDAAHATPHDALLAAVLRRLQQSDAPVAEGRLITLPVCYGGHHGEDLAGLAAHAGLGQDEVIARHCAVEYRVAMLGFAPGFAYLLGLDPQLAMPRRSEPRLRVPAGSVAIGGAQTGIYPRELPGGWQLLGRTPLTLFDAARKSPSLLQPGDRVRFVPIDAGQFARQAAPIA